MSKALTHRSLLAATQKLARRDKWLGRIFALHGPPPLWDREPGFQTLLRIILEQQVSLASARACFDRLCQRVGDVTPEKLLSSTDDELKKDGFSRQKASYARYLSEAVLERRVDLESFSTLADEEVKSELMKLKGVGEWTSDIYLLMAMLRPDVMPKGDVALHTAWHRLSGESRPTSDEFIRIAERWKPYRSVAARMLWHFYLSEKRG